MYWMCNKTVPSVMTIVSTFMKADWFLLLFKSRVDIQFLQFVTVNNSAMGDQKLHVTSNNHSGGWIWWPLLRTRKHVYSCHQQSFIHITRTFHSKHPHCYRWPSVYQACTLLSALPISLLSGWSKRASLIHRHKDHYNVLICGPQERHLYSLLPGMLSISSWS